MDKPTAFARAWGYLDYSRWNKASAYLAGGLAALLAVLLLGVLGLFLDLLVYRGRVPTLAELTPTQRARFDAVREAAGVATEGDWRNHVTELLASRVSDDAAAAYNAVQADGPTGLGPLSLVVRGDGRWPGSLGAWLARTGPWAWSPYGTPEANVRYLLGLLGVACTLAVLRALCVHRMRAAAADSTLAAATRLRRAVYHHTYRLGTLAVKSLGPTEAVGVFTRHVENVQDALYSRLVTLVSAPLLLGAVLLFALAIKPLVAVAFIFFAGIVVLVGEQLAAGYRARSQHADRGATHQLALLEESLMLMRVVKCNLMEAFNGTRVERQLADLGTAQAVRRRQDAVFQPLLVLLALLAASLALAAAGWVALRDALGVPSLVLLVTTLAVAFFPLRELMRQNRAVERGRASAEELFGFLDRPGEIGQAVGAEFLPSLSKGIEFRDVSLREPGTNRRLLSHVSLTVPAGGRIGLVGTDPTAVYALLYLLPRFLDPTKGEVRLDGKDVRWLTLDSLRAQIGMVAANLVFNDTVANNIGCGDEAFGLPRIIEAAKLAHAHQFIQKLPLGYETPIGEMGTSLRPGERFRIALARAILRDPALFVIEEPDADLDEATKDALDDTLGRVLPGRTTIFLPHRISTIRSCDTIYVLNKGKVAASGDHRHLLETSPLYKHLHYVEFNEFAEQA